jgi:hypothetical protein
MVILTRLLYSYDEVILNIMFSLFEKKNFNKVIFWTAEVFHSGFVRELYDFTYKIYYDFYALYSNIPVYKIEKKLSKFKKEKEIRPLLECLYILYQSEPFCEIFIIAYFTKFKKVTKIKNFKNVFDIINLLITQKKINLVINYLYAMITQNKNETIEAYNEFIKNLTNKKSSFKIKGNIAIFSQLLAHFFKNVEFDIIKNKKKRNNYKNFSQEFINYYDTLTFEKYENALQKKRHYEIDDIAGSFYLDRFVEKKDISQIFWYNWEYYSRNTPFWMKKYKNYNIQWDKKDIIFPNDDKLEEFYGKYSYDLDELPFDVSNKSIKKIEKNSILTFLFKYFKIINIPLKKNKIDIKKQLKY